MRPTLATVRGRMDRRFANAFEQTRPNAIEAAARDRDMAAYVERSVALARDGYVEEALDRLEDARIAAARCIEALIGARLSQAFRSRAHVALAAIGNTAAETGVVDSDELDRATRTVLIRTPGSPAPT